MKTIALEKFATAAVSVISKQMFSAGIADASIRRLTVARNCSLQMEVADRLIINSSGTLAFDPGRYSLSNRDRHCSMTQVSISVMRL